MTLSLSWALRLTRRSAALLKEIILKEQIKKYFEENKDIMVSELSELIKIPSVGVTDSAFDGEIKNVFSCACRLAEKYGFKTESKRRYALAKTFSGRGQIGIFSHLDVVPAKEDEWSITSPFSPLVKGGALFGRGSIDDKCAAIIAIHAADAIKKLSIPFNSELLLYMGGDEECGMTDLAEFVKNERMPDISLVPDNEFPVCLGEKGIAVLELECKNEFEYIKNISGGSVHNVSLGEITAELPCGTFTGRGVSTHAAMPEGSVNAGLALCDKLLEMDNIPDSDKKILLTMKNSQKSPYGEFFGIDCSDSRFGKLTCVNGVVKTQGGKLAITLDIRYGTEISFSEIKEKISASLPDFTLKVLTDKPPFVLPENDLGRRFEEIYNDVTGKTAKAYYSGGGTYARMLKNAYGVGTSTKAPDLSLPEGHGSEHQPDECISVDGLTEAAEIITHMLIVADKNY